MKKLTLILVCIFIFMLASCQSQGESPDKKTPPVHSSNVGENDPGSNTPNHNPANPGSNSGEVDTSGFQKEMHVQSPFRIRAVCKTELGYYIGYDGFVYFMDGATGNVTPLCAKPECSHTGDDCNAWVNTDMLSYYQGKIYYVNSDLISDRMRTLWSLEPNGTNRTKIQKLQHEFLPWRNVMSDPILTNGSLYFLDGGTQIYTVKLGEDISKAVLIFEDDMSHTLESEWKFWADGGEVYAMNRILDDTGRNQDILYRLGAAQSETREIWRSTALARSVGDASWYITGGHLYYYISGGDLWDVDLGTGGAERMLALGDTFQSATALFTEEAFILLDDRPDSQWGGVGGIREGGERLTAYDYSGKLLGEVSLSSVYERYDNVVACSLIFAEGTRVFLLADRGMYRSTSNLLICADWAEGSVTEAANWPGADVIYEDKPPIEVEIGPVEWR